MRGSLRTFFFVGVFRKINRIGREKNTSRNRSYSKQLRRFFLYQCIHFLTFDESCPEEKVSSVIEIFEMKIASFNRDYVFNGQTETINETVRSIVQVSWRCLFQDSIT